MEKKIDILLVEDDEVDVMNVKRAFKNAKIINTLHVAGNGQEALDLLRGKRGTKITPLPRIVLLDINMPRMNGIEFLREIRKDPELRALSVFVLTTSNDDTDRFEAYQLNVAGYILKPVGVESFMKALAQLQVYWQLIELPEPRKLGRV